MKRFYFLYTLIFLFLTSFVGCSSSQRGLTPTGSFEKFNIHKHGLEYAMLFNYDKQQNLKSVFAEDKENKFYLKCIIKYTQKNKIKRLNFQNLIKRQQQTVNIAWMESYFYSRTGKLIAVETSYKTPYSISQNNTTYLRSKFIYENNLPIKIKTKGLSFRTEYLLNYNSLGNLTDFEFRKYKYARHKKQELQHFKVYLKNYNTIKKIVDLKTNKKITKRSDFDLFNVDDILRPLNQLRYSNNKQEISNDLKKQYL